MKSIIYTSIGILLIILYLIFHNKLTINLQIAILFIGGFFIGYNYMNLIKYIKK
jgi:membrane-bound ClpP family serine protease